MHKLMVLWGAAPPVALWWVGSTMGGRRGATTCAQSGRRGAEGAGLRRLHYADVQCMDGSGLDLG